jgi:hypothetical protein
MMASEAEIHVRKAHEDAIAQLTRIRIAIKNLREEERLARLHIKDCEAACRVFDIEISQSDDCSGPFKDAENVREFTLSFLKASTEGTKASIIRAAYQNNFGKHLHPKTVGMTLYRLKQDGLAAIQGHIWRYRNEP